jgi:hypothetical protein
LRVNDVPAPFAALVVYPSAVQNGCHVDAVLVLVMIMMHAIIRVEKN